MRKFKVLINKAYLTTEPEPWADCVVCGKEITTHDDSYDVFYTGQNTDVSWGRQDTCSKECANAYILSEME